ncbi:hypothetical protein DFH09DRAFT_1503435 [Mycena vulgaris]|nr:hypothetical protein DFH09DRAFT_1503435 [Mycena vulgaris]
MSYLGVEKHPLRVRGALACPSSSARITASDVESKSAVFELGGGGALESCRGFQWSTAGAQTKYQKRDEDQAASRTHSTHAVGGLAGGKGNGRDHGLGVGTGRHRRSGKKTDGMEERAKGGKGAPAAGVVECMCGTPAQATGTGVWKGWMKRGGARRWNPRGKRTRLSRKIWMECDARTIRGLKPYARHAGERLADETRDQGASRTELAAFSTILGRKMSYPGVVWCMYALKLGLPTIPVFTGVTGAVKPSADEICVTGLNWNFERENKDPRRAVVLTFIISSASSERAEEESQKEYYIRENAEPEQLPGPSNHSPARDAEPFVPQQNLDLDISYGHSGRRGKEVLVRVLNGPAYLMTMVDSKLWSVLKSKAYVETKREL